MFRLYAVTNTINNKVYVGKTSLTVQQRWIKHASSARKGSRLYFHKALRRYGENSFRLCELGFSNTEKGINEAEKYYISAFKSNLPDFGYNGTDGGDGVTMTEEIKEKIRSKATGRKHSEETKELIRKIRTGTKATEESRKKRSEWLQKNHPMLGRRMSDEAKEKLRAAWVKRKQRIASGEEKHPRAGWKPTEEIRAKMSEGQKRRFARERKS